MSLKWFYFAILVLLLVWLASYLREDFLLRLEPSSAEVVQVFTPQRGAAVASPLVIEGLAVGRWFFEASFPVKLVASDGRVLATSYAEAQSDWMTEGLVPFIARLSFTVPEELVGRQAWLVFEKDNPSGLPEHDDSRRLPISL